MPAAASAFSVLEIRLPQDNELTLESMSSLLANFSQTAQSSLCDRLFNRHHTIASLEIVLLNGQIHFCLAVPPATLEHFRSQILAQYPSALTRKIDDYLTPTSQVDNFLGPNQRVTPANARGQPEDSSLRKNLCISQLNLVRPYYYPLKSVRDFRDTDPLNSILSPLARSNPATAGPPDFFLYQILITNASPRWQSGITSLIQNGILVDPQKNYRASLLTKLSLKLKSNTPAYLPRSTSFLPLLACCLPLSLLLVSTPIPAAIFLKTTLPATSLKAN